MQGGSPSDPSLDSILIITLVLVFNVLLHLFPATRILRILTAVQDYGESSFIYFNWSSIALQYRDRFCCTLANMNHR